MFFHRCRLATIPYGCSLVMKTLRFTTLPGDGIGPEVMEVALKVLDALGSKHGFCTKARPTTPEESESTTTGKPCLPPPCPPANKPTPFFSARSADRSGKTFRPSNSPNEPPSSPCARLSRALCQSTPGQPLSRIGRPVPSAPTNRGQRNRRSLRSRTYRRSLFRPTQANRDPR